MKKHLVNRRKFLKQSIGLALGATGLQASLGALQAVNAMANLSAFNDYKALVCIFLAGGNDAFNTVVPLAGDGYAEYEKSRGNLALGAEQLLPLGNTAFGTHPAASAFADLFNNNKMAILANVGSLVEPVSKAQYQKQSVALPPQLFSHNDQQNLWMSGSALGGGNTGWAGRLADMMASAGMQAEPSFNIGFGSSNLFQMGEIANQYNMSAAGAIELHGKNYRRGKRSFDAFMALQQSAENESNVLIKEYAKIQKRADTSAEIVSTALEQATDFSNNFTRFGNGQFADQLMLTAQMIASRNYFSANRQIFFIKMGGWDTHAQQNKKHEDLLTQLTTNVAEFQAVLESLNLADQVTTFTNSEFGRSLASNGDGCDHGWGGHSFIIGNAVTGGKIYGDMPSLAIEGANDAGNGRVIPTLAVDQYAATLARWFGLADGEIIDIFPNLNRFNESDLGFMA